MSSLNVLDPNNICEITLKNILVYVFVLCALANVRVDAHTSDLLRSDSCQIIPNPSLSVHVYSGYYCAFTPVFFFRVIGWLRVDLCCL